MVQYQSTASLDDSFSALSDPTRRAILDRLGNGTASISELADTAGISLTGIKKHVQILERAELVTTEKRGRTRYCRLGPRQLEDVSAWIDSYRRRWDERFDRLDEILERRKGSAR